MTWLYGYNKPVAAECRVLLIKSVSADERAAKMSMAERNRIQINAMHVIMLRERHENATNSNSISNAAIRSPRG